MKSKIINSSLVLAFAFAIAGLFCMMAPSVSDAAVAARTIKLAHVLPPTATLTLAPRNLRNL